MNELPLCKCGCGKPVKRVGNKYIHNHHTKNKPGRIVPDEEKRKHSEYAKLRWKDPDYRKHTIESMKVTHNLPSVKYKKSQISKKQWDDPVFYSQQLIAKNRSGARKKNSESQIGNKRSKETGLKLKLVWYNKTEEEKQKIILKIKQTKIKRGTCISDDRLSYFMIYYRKVQHFTNISLKKKYTEKELKKRKLAGIKGALHIDHKFSISQGFKHNILPCIIGSKSNLELIPWLDNYKKHIKCSITKENLFDLYKIETKKEFSE